MQESSGNNVSASKPIDEEPMAVHNPEVYLYLLTGKG